MRKGTILTFVFVFALASYPTASLAIGTAEQRAACTPDVFRLCSSEIPFVSKIVACLQQKRTQLNPKCRAYFNGPKTQQAAARTRSLRAPAATPTVHWCNFHEVARGEQQEKWLEWCGPNAHE